MGIRRTPTGRIYYDSEGERQTQVVGLLGQLGERLKRSEAERGELWKEMQEYRRLISDIEDKTAGSEKAYISLHNKISRTEKLEAELLKRQEQLEKSHKEHVGKSGAGDKSYKSLAKRLDDSESLTSALAEKLEASEKRAQSLDRRIEQITQDRSRLTRKLERMEETLLETQDALRAKALVLLTDRSLAAQTNMPQLSASTEDRPEITATGSVANDAVVSATGRQLASPRIAGTTFMVVAALLLGWSLNGWLYSGGQKVMAPRAPAGEVSGKLIGPAASPKTGNSAADASLRDVSAGVAEAIAPLDTGNYDEQALLAEMEDNPEALAARLNAIEPSVTDITEIIETAAEEGMEDADGADGGTVSPAAYTDAGTDIEDLRPVPEDLIGPDESLPESVSQIEAQAFAGNASSQHDLAAIYTAGYGGVPKNYEKAAFWFRQAADQGIGNARYNLGVLYHQGLGVKQDIDQAMHWYAEASKTGHPEAQYNLGIAHIEGIGVEYDPHKAAEYFEKAASRQITEAAYNLGLIHENGLLGDASPEEALLWYKTAADWGSPEARSAMEQLARSLNIEPEEIDRIVDAAGAGQKAGVAAEEAETDAGIGAQGDLTAASSVPSVTALIQEQLISMGLFPGPVDGLSSPLTSDAIRSYQKANGLEITGTPDEELLEHMLAGSGVDTGDVGSREQ